MRDHREIRSAGFDVPDAEIVIATAPCELSPIRRERERVDVRVEPADNAPAARDHDDAVLTGARYEAAVRRHDGRSSARRSVNDRDRAVAARVEDPRPARRVRNGDRPVATTLRAGERMCLPNENRKLGRGAGVPNANGSVIYSGCPLIGFTTNEAIKFIETGTGWPMIIWTGNRNFPWSSFMIFSKGGSTVSIHSQHLS
jgi:hypothetical protein